MTRRRKAEMKVILSVIFLVLSLLHSVQGVGQCAEASFCGCQLQDASNNSLIDVALEFVNKKYDYNFINDRDFCVSLNIGR